MRSLLCPLLALSLLTVSACSGSDGGSTPPTDTGDEQVETPTEEPPATDPSLTGILDEAGFKALHQLSGDAAPAPKGETIALAGSEAYLSLPENAEPGVPLPAVVVVHEWWGLNDHIRHWTDRLAEDGYAAIAVDLYGGQVATTPEEAMSLMKAVDKSVAAALLSAAHDHLQQDPRIHAEKQGVIGWCFGGGWSLRHAIATADLDAAVIYYGHPEMDAEQLARIEAPLLAVYANQDESIPPEVVDAFAKAIEDAGKSMELHRYDANHAFANPSSARYDEASATDAWAKVRTFLNANLRGE